MKNSSDSYIIRARELLSKVSDRMSMYDPNTTVLSEVNDFLDTPAPSGPSWRYITAEGALPEGTPVAPGTTVYAFDGSNGHWEYKLPKLPIATRSSGS